MAKNLVDGADTAKPDSAATTDQKPVTFADVANASSAKDSDEKTGEKVGAPAEVTPVAKSDAAATSDKPAEKPTEKSQEAKQRTAEVVRVDVVHYLASRAEVDWSTLDEISAAVNEPGADGKKRTHVAKGIVDKILDTLIEQARVEHELGPSQVKRFRLTAQTRREIDSPAVVHAQRRAIVSILNAGLVYTETDKAPAIIVGLTSAEIAFALMLGSAKGELADKARASGRAPTLPDDTADMIRNGLAAAPEKDPGPLLARVVGHLGRLVEAGMVGAPPSDDATLGAAAESLKEAGVKIAAEVIPEANRLYVLTEKAKEVLFEDGVRAVVDATFPPKAPKPTVEQLEREAEERVALIIAGLKKEAEAARTIAMTHETMARENAKKVSAVEAWLRNGGVKSPGDIITSAVNKFMTASLGSDFETFDYSEEITTDAHTAQRIQNELTALKAELVRVIERHKLEKGAMSTLEGTFTTKIADRTRIMDAWGNNDRITVTITKKARSIVDDSGDIVVVSEDEHDRGRILKRSAATPNTQFSMPGTGLPNERTPSKSSLTDAIKGAADKFKSTLADAGASVKITTPDGENVTVGEAKAAKPTRWEKPVELSAKGMKEPLEAFMLINERGVLASALEERFFEFFGTPKPNAGTVAIFLKVLDGALKKGAITKAEGGEHGVIYWHSDNPDPRLTNADKEPKAKGTTAKDKPKAPPAKKGRSGKA